MDQIINHAVLSLDFWQDTVTYLDADGCAICCPKAHRG